MRAGVAAAVGAGVAGTASADGHTDGPSTAAVARGELKRFATTAYGAEVTGPFVFDAADNVASTGQLIFSLQHPYDQGVENRDNGYYNQPAFQQGAIGYVDGFAFDADGDSDEFDELSTPQSVEDSAQVRTAAGDYTILAREREAINDGSENLGVPQTPDGTNVTEFAGSKYSQFGNDPDMNQFVGTPDGEYSGYLYTNFEQSPGTLSRIPLNVSSDGSIEAFLSSATNLANYDGLRDLGGTRINCYGDLSPWGTPLSAEEEYSHPRVSYTATVSEMVDDGGVGRRGAAAFYNRPNPTGIAGAVGDYYDESESWYPQGTFALSGLEIQAYYLGAAPVDQAGGENDLTPVEGPYPNRYRYGYIVDFRNPAARDPADVEPVKYYVMGRAAWEAPDVQRDQQTAYLCSDGDDKGIYKFVADRPIPSYADPMDVAGTLYAPKVTNEAAASGAAPGEVNLELDWIELGHASNAEVESWIAEYDDIDQVDYLETHAESWSKGDEVTAAVLEEADRAVVESGNRDYITDEEIVEWAEQHEQRGPDGVDEELRRVPFLETRAAAKEVGASIEFHKAEGIDSADDATPGDYVYIGLSEFTTGMADDAGDVRLQKVAGGVVYRARLEPDYNVSTLEPVIVGPTEDSPADVADDALLNVDNVYTLADGRVLCCEDADQLGRSYPNDGLYVFTPEDAGPGRSRKAPNGNGRGRGA